MLRSTMFLKIIGVFLAGLFLAGSAVAAEPEADAPDFANHPLAGPEGTGSVVSDTYGDIMMSFGARMRVIPTSEGDWDFGFKDDLGDLELLGGTLDSAFFRQHANESGWVNENYIRTEAQIYFNTMPRDRKWSFHAALEFDRPVDTVVVDDRGGYNDRTSEFGLERLHGSYKISDTMRFHAGYDIWFVGDPAGLTYGDDAPGFWVDGSYGDWDYNAAYFKLSENNWGTEPSADRISDSKNDDRDLYAGYTDYNISENRKIKGIYMYDRIRNVNTGTMLESIVSDAKTDVEELEDLGFAREDSGSVDALLGLAPDAQAPDTDSHYLGLVYEAETGIANYFLEGIYQFGQADDTGLDENELYAQGRDDYDINAFAFAGDLELDLGDSVGYGFKPHLGFIYASGDDDPDDDELGGYTGVVSHQRFTKFGGEDTIMADGNTMLGSVVYSYLPGLYGNGTPVVTGGLPNATSLGSSRGDNPGLTMTSAGITLEPRRFLTFKSNVNSFWWNEDTEVQSFVDGTRTDVDSGYVGTEWDNELTLALSRHTIVKAQGALFFPGEVMEDVTSARSATPSGPGEESDDMAYRLGMEFIWMF
ncbi:MAG: hypothetical protein ACLFQ9_07605 [Desulfobacterales bacterium]